ncbi:MAG: NTP transferase domain-containing protein [Chloroflexota bacterium]
MEARIPDADGVILAAGYSSRAGAFKLALPLGGRAVIQRAVEGMAPFVRRILVVTGHHAERVAALVADHPQVTLVHNEGYAAGMLSSIQAGAAQVSAPRFFLLPGDHPLIAPDVCRRLLAVAALVVQPTYGGHGGHPILLASALIPEILALPADATLRDLLRRTPSVRVEVEDDGILLDLDTSDDYARLAQRLADAPQ